MASPAFRRKMDLPIFKIQLHSNKLEIFKHHIRSLLLMLEFGHLQVKEYNRGVCGGFVCLFVQATNESNWKHQVKSLVQRTYFSIYWRSLTLPKSILLWWQPFLPLVKLGLRFASLHVWLLQFRAFLDWMHICTSSFKSSISPVWKWHNCIFAWHPHSHLLTVTSVAIFL